MRSLIIFAVLLFAANATRVSNNVIQHDLLTRLREEINRDPFSSTTNLTSETTETSPAADVSHSSTANAVNEGSSTANPTSQTTKPQQETALEEVVAELTTALPSLPIDELEPSKRRIVTYDQRQEGQYNIRADLENFMIVLIPPNPSEGLNLLDLLTKSSYRRNQPHSSKNKRKHTSALQFSPENVFKHQNGQHFNYIGRSTSPTNSVGLSSAKQTPVAVVEGTSASSGSQRLPEFIEGRTPYHVDISANDDEQSRLHPDLQVDVLPPPYPLAYQHLIKPFHLEAEPAVIQALPPPELQTAHVSGNFLESYKQLLTSGLKTAAAAESSARARHNNDGPELGYYRISRAIRSDNSIDSNNLSSSQSTPNRFAFFREHMPARYPPIDLPEGFYALKHQRRTIDKHTDSIDVRDQVLDDEPSMPRIIVPPLNSLPQDDIEQDLHDIRLLDLEARTLLSDGIERCAPGHRRDSYGMCREIEGY